MMTIRSNREIEKKTTTPESLFFAHLLRPPGAFEEALETPHAGSPPHLFLVLRSPTFSSASIITLFRYRLFATRNPIEIDHRVELRRCEVHPQREVKLLYVI